MTKDGALKSGRGSKIRGRVFPIGEGAAPLTMSELGRPEFSEPFPHPGNP